jgi:RNA polymerase sigma-70 factor, ECF subfamily
MGRPPGPSHPPADALHQAVRRLRAGRGGPEDQELVFRHTYRPLTTFFANRGLGPQAEDLAQDVLLKAFGSFEELGSAERFDAWLRAITVNVWKNAIRHIHTVGRDGTEVPLEALEGAAEPVAPRCAVAAARTGDPEGDILDRELGRDLGRALAELPAGMRRAMELYLQDHKYREIAALLGVSLGTVQSQIFEARKRLRPLLAPEAGTDAPGRG